eukprot:scaffold4849_cov153-Amphora_coffeaeformis.AAC.10
MENGVCVSGERAWAQQLTVSQCFILTVFTAELLTRKQILGRDHFYASTIGGIASIYMQSVPTGNEGLSGKSATRGYDLWNGSSTSHGLRQGKRYPWAKAKIA